MGKEQIPIPSIPEHATIECKIHFENDVPVSDGVVFKLKEPVHPYFQFVDEEAMSDVLSQMQYSIANLFWADGLRYYKYGKKASTIMIGADKVALAMGLGEVWRVPDMYAEFKKVNGVYTMADGTDRTGKIIAVKDVRKWVYDYQATIWSPYLQNVMVDHIQENKKRLKALKGKG